MRAGELIFSFRDAMFNRSSRWQQALKTWKCPTLPSRSVGACDPCSIDFGGNWDHMYCRGPSNGACCLTDT